MLERSCGDARAMLEARNGMQYWVRMESELVREWSPKLIPNGAQNGIRNGTQLELKQGSKLNPNGVRNGARNGGQMEPEMEAEMGAMLG